MLLSLLIFIVLLSGFSVAKDYSDISVCEDVMGSKDNCYSRVAYKQKDWTICENIERNHTKALCYSNLGGVDEQGNILCERLGDQDSRDSCYSSVALRQNRVSFCEVIVNERSKNGCYASLKIDEQGNILCEKISEDYLDSKDRCYYHLAQKVEDKIYCEEMSNQKDIENCYTEFDGIKRAKMMKFLMYAIRILGLIVIFLIAPILLISSYISLKRSRSWKLKLILSLILFIFGIILNVAWLSFRREFIILPLSWLFFLIITSVLGILAAKQDIHSSYFKILLSLMIVGITIMILIWVLLINPFLHMT